VAAALSLMDAENGNRGGQYLPGGFAFVVEIVEWRDRPSRKAPGTWLNIVEFTILESTCALVQVGARYSIVYKYHDKWGKGKNDIKGLCIQVLEKLHPEWQAATQWRDEFKGWLVGEDQPARGVRLQIVTSEHRKKDSVDVYTKYDITVLDPGQALGLVPAGGVAPAAPVWTPPAAAPAPAPGPGNWTPPAAAPAAAPAWTPPGPVAAQPPPGWPSNMEYPSGRLIGGGQ